MLTSSPSLINSGDVQATKLLSFHDAFSEQLREAVPGIKFRELSVPFNEVTNRIQLKHF